MIEVKNVSVSKIIISNNHENPLFVRRGNEDVLDDLMLRKIATIDDSESLIILIPTDELPKIESNLRSLGVSEGEEYVRFSDVDIDSISAYKMSLSEDGLRGDEYKDEYMKRIELFPKMLSFDIGRRVDNDGYVLVYSRKDDGKFRELLESYNIIFS